MTILIPCACLVFAVTLALSGKLWDRKPARRGYYLRLLAYRLGWRKGYQGPHERVTLTERELKVLASVIEAERKRQPYASDPQRERRSG